MRIFQPRKQLSNAFSLVEVVIALGIFAFVIIPVIGLTSQGIKSLRQSMDDTVRANIAREIVGEALRTPYTNLAATYNNIPFYYTDEGIRLPSKVNAVFIASNSIATLPANNSLGVTADTNIAEMLTVTVTHIQDTNNKQVFSQLLLNTH
jgi:uncharacterized protein (TIGR02598 family)